MSAIAKCQRIRLAVATDRRLRAALIAYLTAAVFIAVTELLAWTATIVPLNPVLPTSNVNDGWWPTDGAVTAASAFIFRILGLLLLTYVAADPQQYKFSTQAFAIGVVTGLAIAQLASDGTSPLTKIFSVHLYAVANFHFSEFFVTGLTNPESLRPDSFLLNHSKSYWIAITASGIEFGFKSFMFPAFYSKWIVGLGIVLCLTGEVLRKLAMCHASIGFTHQIAIRRKRNHALVTSGVYALCRHPGYLGWWLWSVGTQVILCNPLCTIVYAYVTYHFFDDRIYDEERYLIEFFGQRYIAYQKRVGTGLPGIHGFSSVVRRSN